MEYTREFNKLIGDEDNFEYFRNIIIAKSSTESEYVKTMLDDLLEFAEKNNLIITKAWTYYYIGWNYNERAEYYKAIEYFFMCHDIFEVVGDKKGLIFACNGLTSLYCEIGQFKLANEWGLKGISLCEEINEKDAMIILLINTGINYINMKCFNKAEDILNSIEMMNYELTESQFISYTIAKAEIEVNIGDSKKVLCLLDALLDLDNEEVLGTAKSEIFKLRGMAYLKLNDYKNSENEFKKSDEHSIKYSYYYEKCNNMLEWSKLLCVLNRYNEAINLLESAAEISKSKKLNMFLCEAYDMLYIINKELNNSETALYYLEEYLIIHDEIYDYEQNQLMAKMNIKHSNLRADIYKLLYDKTECLSMIGQKIISNLDIDSVIDVIIKEINQLIHTDILGIAIYDDEKGKAVYNFVNEHSEKKQIVAFDIADDSILGAYCIKNRKDIIISNIKLEYMKYVNAYKYNILSDESMKTISMIYTPMIINDKVVGLMTVQSYKENAYDKNDLNTLKIIANYSAIAIDNAVSFKKVEEVALYDYMTGFLTRFEIIRLGELFYKKYKDDDKKFSVIMIDIDNFKSINDKFGHVNGDKAINMVTDTISKCVRNTDYIGRYGGDEFLLICPGTTEREAVDVAERIRETISSSIYMLEENIPANITISLGVYEFGNDESSFVEGIKEADKCLYYAKTNSKNKVVYNK